MIGTASIDVEHALDRFDFTTAERWHVLLLCGGAPAARVELPSPGRTQTNALAEAALMRRADGERARRELIARLRRRLANGTVSDEPQPHVSVVVCTHRRPDHLPGLLNALLALSPPPLETIIVDNDPGDHDCRGAVERVGFRYLREDRRGLDNARNAGLRAARGEVVAFTDDDCVPAAGWLAPLARAFAESSVAAVTGPAFPYRLDTPARVRMERQASLARGLHRVTFDWRSFSPLHASAAGVGANLAIRRDALARLGSEPFPPELDAGTVTESGGDTYFLARLLALGCRLVYEPEMLVFHLHRADARALRRAVHGYGVGLSAALTKLLIEQRELSAPRAWAWLVKQYVRTQGRRALGRADAIDTRLSWCYLRGGLLGSSRWLRSRREQRALTSGRPSGRPDAHPPGRPERSLALAADSLGELRRTPGGRDSIGSEPNRAGLSEPVNPRISVIIPTCRRPAALGRCLRALESQEAPPHSFEVIVIDDDPKRAPGPVDASALDCHRGGTVGSSQFTLRLVGSGGCGAAAARNLGARSARAPLLLFLDDDIVADPGLIAAHLRRHSQRLGKRIAVVGPYRPHPTRENLVSANARLWWQEMFGLLEQAERPTFVAALSANLSMPRELFEELDGFDERIGRARREDWEWGLRALRGRVELVYDADASAHHEFTLTTAARLRDARREGFGDAQLARRFPESIASLPILSHHPARWHEPHRWLGFRAWDLAPVRTLALGVLSLLERARCRQAWSRLFGRAQALAYAQGLRAAGWCGDDASQATTISVELLDDVPIPPPSVAVPRVRVTLAGRELATIVPREGVWTGSLSEQIAEAIPHEEIERAADAGRWLTQSSPCVRPWGQVELLLGPANADVGDPVRRAAFESRGVLVRTVRDGDPRGPSGRDDRGHWGWLAASAMEAERPLLALPFPGTAPDPIWLEEALDAFDGERVGLVFGGALDSSQPRQALYLHDRRSRLATLALNDSAPAYVVLRRELAGTLEGAQDAPGAWLRAIDGALRDGWLVARRNVHGLSGTGCCLQARARAFARVRVHEARSARRTKRVPPDVPSIAGDALLLTWEIARRPKAKSAGLLRGVALGAAEGFRDAGVAR